MTTLHPTLRIKLERLRAAHVRFCAEKQCFVYGDGAVRKRGITKLLAALVPVPRSKCEDDDDDEYEERVPVLVQNFAGSVMRRCAHCKSAVLWMRSLDVSKSSIARRLLGVRDADRAHGLVIDYQLETYVRHGRTELFKRCAVVDPCVGTLIEQIDANGWSLVATQVPIFDARTDVATAIDLLATDRATRSELYLIEVKASRGTKNDDEYERTRGVLKRSTLRGLPQSYYARHQLQLLFMNDAVERQLGFRFDRSLVMRVAPGVVRTYELARQFIARRDDVAHALALITGKDQKTKKRAAGKAPNCKRRKK